MTMVSSVQPLISIGVLTLTTYIMENLDRKKVTFFSSIPLYYEEHYDVVEQHFGDDYPEYICDFLHDLLNLVDRRKEEAKLKESTRSLKRSTMFWQKWL